MKKNILKFIFLIFFLLIGIKIYEYDRDKYKKEQEFWGATNHASTDIIISIKYFYDENKILPKNTKEFVEFEDEFKGFKMAGLREENGKYYIAFRKQFELEQSYIYVTKDIQNKTSIEKLKEPIKALYYIKEDRKNRIAYVSVRFRDSDGNFLFSKKSNRLFGFEDKIELNF